MILIEKEFLSFGHQFALRIGISSKKDSNNEDQRSPIFLQWLDIIHQLLNQFPEAFEFNMDFLLYLGFHYNSCLYGTFLYNCESERFEKKAKIKTTSIWTDILRNVNKFTNNSYSPVEFIAPNYSPFKIRLWEEFFFKFNTSMEKKNTNKSFVFLNKQTNFSSNVNSSVNDNDKLLAKFNLINDKSAFVGNGTTKNFAKINSWNEKTDEFSQKER